jgi:haloacetate dehalogenase
VGDPRRHHPGRGRLSATGATGEAPEALRTLIPGFTARLLRLPEADIAVATGGSGPPVLLLHGYPQTHAMWHRVAPALAEHHAVVAADLRGYGASAKPAPDPEHAAYSKRAMAADQVAAMAALGFTRFAVVGHDRGARVAHRMALDHPEAVARMAVLDIVPTHALLTRVDAAFATAYYHWFFLIQPDGLPERMIGADPEWFLRETLRRWAARPGALAEEAVAEYARAFADPAAIRASCEDYRAAASIDLAHDAADRDRRVGCPTLVLWGAQGAMGRLYDVLASWRDYAREVSGEALPCGHFLAEEAPAETLSALRRFLRA